MYLKGRVTEERKRSLSATSLPRWPKQLGICQSVVEKWKFHPGTSHGCWTQVLNLSFSTFPSALAGTWIRSQGSNWNPYMMPMLQMVPYPHCATTWPTDKCFRVPYSKMTGESAIIYVNRLIEYGECWNKLLYI